MDAIAAAAPKRYCIDVAKLKRFAAHKGFVNAKGFAFHCVEGKYFGQEIAGGMTPKEIEQHWIEYNRTAVWNSADAAAEKKA